MRIFLLTLILILSFQTWTKAEDVRDFELEGMSIGDSALDYFEQSVLEKNKRHSWYDTKNFIPIAELYLSNSSTYESFQIAIKTNDKNYRIQALSGFIFYRNNDFDKCILQLDDIASEIKGLFNNVTDTGKQTYKHSYDKSGKSNVTAIHLILDSGDQVGIQCIDWAEKYTYLDQLRISVRTKEYIKFLDNAYN